MPNPGSQRYRIPNRAPIAVAPAPAPSRWARLRARPWPPGSIVVAACWLDAAANLGAWGAAGLAPAGFWPAHLFFYGPRWLLALPTLLLLPLAAVLRPRRAAPALAAAALGFAAVWGCNPPWGAEAERSPWRLRLLTCNVQGKDLRVGALADLVRATRPDVVVLQEWGDADPIDLLGPTGWHVREEGEFCLASRYPIAGFEALRRPDEAYRVVAVRARLLWCGEQIPVVAAHLMTPRDGLEAVLRSPIGGLGAFRRVAAVQGAESGLLRRWAGGPEGRGLVAGDFNLTGEHPLFRRDWRDYEDAFARAGRGLGRTMLTRLDGLRIDHVLCGRAWRATRCEVGPDVGSAHRPVIADVEWVGPPPGHSGPRDRDEDIP